MEVLRRIGSGSGLILVATLLGVATTAAAFVWLNHERDAARPLSTEPVVIVRVSVPAGTALKAEMVELRDVPVPNILPGAIRDLGAVVGRTTRYPLAEKEQILPFRLVTGDEKTSNGLAYAIPAGMRAVAAPITEVIGAGGLIVPGDHVDVLVSTTYGRLFAPYELLTSEKNNDVGAHPIVITVLQDVIVLAVAQQSLPPYEEDRDPATLRQDKAPVQQKAGSITLAVTPEQAQILFMATQEGVLHFAVRSFRATPTRAVEPLFRLQPTLLPNFNQQLPR